MYKICAMNNFRFALCGLGVLLVSCINNDYDLNKELDTTVKILEDVTIPIGDLEKFSIEDILKTSDTNSGIETDPTTGNLSFSFKSDEPTETTFSVPAFDIPFKTGGTFGEDYAITIETGEFAGMDGTRLNEQLHFLDHSVERPIGVDAGYSLPAEILDIKYVELDMLLDYKLQVTDGVVHLAEGFIIDFPDWMTIAKADNSDAYILENQGDNKNVIRFLSDVRVDSKHPYILDLKLSKVDFPEGCISNGKISLDESDAANKIIASGDIYLNTKDFPKIPERMSVSMHIEFADMEVKSAYLSVNASLDVETQEMPPIEYPDFFSQEGTVIDLYDAFLNFDVNNSLPLSLSLNADFIGYKNNTQVVSMHIGEDANGKNPVVIAASDITDLNFSKRGQDGNIALPEIGDLLTKLPEKIVVSNVNVTAAKDYITIIPGTTYSCSFGYGFYAPLAFGQDFRFEYKMPIENLELDLEDIGASGIAMTFKAENTIPLRFDLDTEVLDGNGNPIENMTCSVEGSLLPGTVASPNHSDITIKLNAPAGTINETKSLNLVLKATCPAEYAGIALNKDQGLKISDLAIMLPDGITMPLDGGSKSDTSEL